MTAKILRKLSAMILVMLGSLLVSAAPVLALSDDVFVVPRVSVQAQANSAVAAKGAAQRQGRRRAMDILLRRLTVEEDWVYLPKLAAGTPAEATASQIGQSAGQSYGSSHSVITLVDSDLERLESGFEVYNEKSSSTIYRALITYRFKPAAVRKLLKDAQIAYSEAQTRTALVLPVLQTGSGLYLWEDNNPWMAAWKSRPYNNELTPMAAPLGDLEDARSITARQALALNQSALAHMAERYSVSQVIVAHAFLQQTDGEDKLRVRLLNGFRESGELKRLDGFDEPQDGNLGGGSNPSQRTPEEKAFIPAKVGDVLAEGWFRQPSGDFPMLAEQSIDVTIAKHAKPWKEQTLIDHNAAGVFETSAYFYSIGEWAKIRSALVSTPLVGSVQVRALSRRGAEMLIRAYGDPAKLVIAMESQGLALWTQDGEYWMIATPETAQQIQGRNHRSRRRRGRYGANDEGSPYQPVGADALENDSGVKIESDF